MKVRACVCALLVRVCTSCMCERAVSTKECVVFCVYNSYEGVCVCVQACVRAYVVRVCVL